MEDPWGSPWATDTPAKPDDLPAAPQTAHFAVEQHTPRKISHNLSPWGEDDAWGGGGGGWGDAHGGSRSPAWGRSPALKPLDEGSGLVRQPSPDPWKGMGLDHLDTSKLEDVPRSRRGSERSSRDGRIVDSAISMGGEEGLKRMVRDEHSIRGLNVDTHDAWGAEDAPRTLEKEVVPRFQLERSISGETLAGLESDLDHDVDRDREDAKASVVVGVEDEVVRSPSPDAGSIDDKENLEVEVSHIEEEEKETLRNEVDVSAIHEAEIVQDDQIAIESKAVTQHVPWGQEKQEVRAEPEILEKRPPRAARPSISYPVDLTGLDGLFPTTKAIHTQPEPVPDIIIDDSFTSISERKMWYRLSRFGSMRKHNSGDDENYVRVNWAGSEVRDRTIKTVRRWMEEDSITGRVILGRRHGASGASMFNWDSKAPQVEIGELLGRNGKHARHASLMSPVIPPTAASFGWAGSSPSPAAPKQRPMSMIQLATAPKPSHTAKSPLSDVSLPLFEFPPAPRTTSTPSPIPSPVQSSFAQVSPIQPSGLSTVNTADEDDDDWGEMVGTPTVGESEANPFSSEDAGFGAPNPAHLSAESLPNKSNDTKVIPSKINTALNPPSTAWDFSHLEDGWKSATSPKPPLSPSFPSGYTTPAKPQEPPSPIIPTITASPTKFTTALSPTKSTTAPQVTFAEPSASIDEEEIVADILRNLPDLSYMLR